MAGWQLHRDTAILAGVWRAAVGRLPGEAARLLLPGAAPREVILSACRSTSRRVSVSPPRAPEGCWLGLLVKLQGG